MLKFRGSSYSTAAPGGQRHYVFLCGLGIHGDHEIDFFFARDVSVFIGADGVPGRQAGDVRRKQVLARNRNSHLENAAQQNGVGTLRARPVDGRDLNAHVVYDRFLFRWATLCVERYIRGGHSLPSLSLERSSSAAMHGAEPFIIRQAVRSEQAERTEFAIDVPALELRVGR